MGCAVEGKLHVFLLIAATRRVPCGNSGRRGKAMAYVFSACMVGQSARGHQCHQWALL